MHCNICAKDILEQDARIQENGWDYHAECWTARQADATSAKVIRLVSIQTKNEGVTKRLRDALKEAEDFSEIVIVGLNKDGINAHIFASCLPPTFGMLGALGKAWRSIG